MNKGTLWTILSLVCAIVLVNATSQLTFNEKPFSSKQSKRLDLILENLGKIAGHPDSTTLFFGNSIFQLFLSPDAYDRKMTELGQTSESYNLAFAGHVGLGTLAFVERFRSELPPGTQFRESIFEISPVSYAKRFHHESSYALDVVRPGIFLSAGMWPSFFRNEPELALSAVYYAFLKPFDWCEVVSIKNLLPLSWNFMPLAIPDFNTEDPFFEEPAWRADLKGVSSWNLPESKIAYDDLMADFRKPENWARMMRTYVKAHSLSEEFRMDDYGVQVFISALKTARTFSKHVYGIVMPYEPEFQARADKYVDYNKFIERIASQSGITIIDLRKEFPVRSEDFVDAMHMKRESIDRLLSFVADRIHGMPKRESGVTEPDGQFSRSPSAAAH